MYLIIIRMGLMQFINLILGESAVTARCKEE